MSKPVPRLKEAEIKRAAKALAENYLFSATMAPADLIPTIFLPIAMGVLDDYDVPDLGNIYQYMDKAGEYGVNGYPIFTTCIPANHEDWGRIVELANKIEKAVEEILK